MELHDYSNVETPIEEPFNLLPEFDFHDEQNLGLDFQADYFDNTLNFTNDELRLFDNSPDTILNQLEPDHMQTEPTELYFPLIEPKSEPEVSFPQKRTSNQVSNLNKKTKTEPTQRSKRLEANKKSAQASRDRKKHMREVLEGKVGELVQERLEISNEVSRLQTENEVMKKELLSLHEMIVQSPILSKMMERNQNQSIYNIARTEPASTTSHSAAQWYTLIALHMYSQHLDAVGKNSNAAFVA